MPLDPVILRETVIEYAVRTAWAVLVGALALLVARAVRSASMRALARHRARANATVLLGNLAQIGILILGALAILAIYTQGSFGWILTSVSVIGLVIGLSLQDLLKNFFAGIWILVERPFSIGDTIQVEQLVGVVEHISFRTTLLRADDGRQVIVPNADLLTKPIVSRARRDEPS